LTTDSLTLTLDSIFFGLAPDTRPSSDYDYELKFSSPFR
jgi:hypothetical protein